MMLFQRKRNAILQIDKGEIEMPNYIVFSVLKGESSPVNEGLRRVLCYIGNPNRDSEPFVFNKAYYQKGVAIVNRRLNGWSKTAIAYLVHPNKRHTETHYIIRLHKNKTVKILRAIRAELDQCSRRKEISELFSAIYTYLLNLFHNDVHHQADDVIGRAYLREINARLTDPDYANEKKKMKGILMSFAEYNDIKF